jgi:hypothetical protein
MALAPWPSHHSPRLRTPTHAPPIPGRPFARTLADPVLVQDYDKVSVRGRYLHDYALYVGPRPKRYGSETLCASATSSQPPRCAPHPTAPRSCTPMLSFRRAAVPSQPSLARSRCRAAACRGWAFRRATWSSRLWSQPTGDCDSMFRLLRLGCCMLGAQHSRARGPPHAALAALRSQPRHPCHPDMPWLAAFFRAL